MSRPTPQNEYQKFADDAIRSREREEGFGRLRFSLFLAALGPLAMGVIKVAHFEPAKWMAYGIVGCAPLSILLLITNYIKLPNDSKMATSAFMIAFLTLLGAGLTLFLAKMTGLTQLI
jgi:hypothetical protein